MVTIRLQRIGKNKMPHYRVIVTEKHRDPWGKNVEIIGNYNPRSKEATLKEDRVGYWLGVGAQPSNTVRNLLIRSGLVKGDKAKAVAISKKRQGKIDQVKTEAAAKKAAAEEAAKAAKAAEAEAATQAAEAATEPAPEAPAA